jgi:4-amino-4-deoxy-L-arabinose transferase-like glycosyltransferase
MANQSDRTLPNLAGEPFLEKPPLTYWASAESLSMFGVSAAAARVPNLIYALLTALATGALAYTMRGATAAVIAASMAGSSLLAWRVTAWLAPDAGLLAGCTLALLGVYLGYCAPAGRRKLLGYTLMHLGAALGFMAKSAPGWLVPALALLTLIVWEKRWSELRRWELYLGLLLQVAIIAPWIIAVERLPEGAQAVRTLFWNNLAGRFTKISAPVELDYTSGHKNWPGRYLIELPVSFLPWTLLVVAALRRAWVRLRQHRALDTTWRFAIAASLPFLLLLSLSATARDVYAAPLFPAIGLLIALWATDPPTMKSRFDALALRTTERIVAVLAFALTLTLGALMLTATAPSTVGILAFVALLTLSVGVLCWRHVSTGPVVSTSRAIGRTYVSYALVCVSSALVLFPSFDRWQNLGALAQNIQADTTDLTLGLLDPDETTLAMLDYRLQVPFTVVRSNAEGSAAAVSDWFRLHGDGARILVKLPGHADGELTPLINRWQRRKLPNDGTAALLENAGVAHIVARYQRAHSRRYALLGPAGATPKAQL